MPDHSSRRILNPGSSLNYGSFQENFPGAGTEENPYVLDLDEQHSLNPQNMTMKYRVFITLVMAISSLTASLSSSAYMSGADEMMDEFDARLETITLGLSLFVLGHAFGPMVWGPISEIQGRRFVFLLSYLLLSVSNFAVAASSSLAALLLGRLAAGLFASSPLTNAGAIIADIFPRSQRGIAMSTFVLSPYLGPAIGPMIGGFIVPRRGWRFLQAVLGISSGVACLIGALSLPETYVPVILKREAASLTRVTGKVFKIKSERGPKKSTSELFRVAFLRPWVLLFCEPIVTLLAVWTAVIYGTLYSFFNAFPFVYKQRGWSTKDIGLAFIGLAIGMVLGVLGSIRVNRRYILNLASGDKRPERRLDAAYFGTFAIPFGLYWFAITNGPIFPAAISIASGVPFGYGMVLVYLAVSNYLIDLYGVYAASALAANTLLRSLFGAAFPLVAPKIYQTLGIHWAAIIPATMSLICAPFPWLLQKYGQSLRRLYKTDPGA